MRRNGFLIPVTYSKGHIRGSSRGGGEPLINYALARLEKLGSRLQQQSHSPAGESSIPMAQAHNRRRSPRLSLSIDVTLFCLGQGVIKGRICEISEAGFAATLPLDLAFGESVTAEIHLPFGTKTVEAVVRNRIAFRHGFEVLGTDLSEEMHWLQ